MKHQVSLVDYCINVHTIFVLGVLLFNNIRRVCSIQLDVHLPVVSNKTSCLYQRTIEANEKLNEWSSTEHTNEQIHFNKFQDDDVGHNANDGTEQIPHVTLFLTDFALEESGTEQMNNTLFEELAESIRFSIERELDKKGKCYYNTQIQKPLISGSYAMYETVLETTVQELSNRIVTMTQQYVRKDQPIPDWVNNLPDEKIKERKIHFIKEFGSPNVFDEFDPHVTVGFDDGAGNSTNLNKDRFSILSNLAWESCGGWIDEVRIGLVGDYGTVIGEPLAIFDMTHFEPCIIQANKVGINGLISTQL